MKGDGECCEKVQKRAVSMVKNLRAKMYEGRLLEAGLTTLQARKESEDHAGA